MIPTTDISQDEKTLKEIELAINRVMKSNTFILGDELKTFEHKFAQFLNSKYVCGVANGTDALLLSIKALGIRPGDKVLTVSFTSPFTVIAILESGAIPVFCDIDPETLTIDAEYAANKIDRKVKGIIPVHIYGNPCDMGKILDLAKRAKIKVIEDACQAHGASIDNKLVGTFGDAAAFSFYPTKNLGGVGDGGAVATSSKEVFEAVQILRHGGQSKRFWHTLVSGHSRLDELQAAVLQVKLKKLSRENEKRGKIAQRYREELSNLPVKFQKTMVKGKHANHLFVIITKERDNLKKYLKSRGISCDIHYPYPTYTQPAFRQFKQERLTVTEDIQTKILSLPIYPHLSTKDQGKIIFEINNFYKKTSEG